MKLSIRQALTTATVALVAGSQALTPCTNLLVTKGASRDGSTYVTYTADSHHLYGELYFRAGGKHLPGTMRDVIEWDTHRFLGRIPEAPITYKRVGNINEHQLTIGETTFGGRPELKPNGIIDYGSLIYIALERCKTAREAVEFMGKLVNDFGYASSGESFSIADPNEVWIMEMIGKGEGEKGAVWVALKVPDGYICAHANQARIRQFPMNDPQNCLYSKDVISFARKKEWFSGADKDFSFCETYAPWTPAGLRSCEARVWSIFNRAAPSLKIPVDFAMGNVKAAPLPLWIKPDQKIGLRDAMELMRDHYEGTPMDMTKDVGAGPHALPYRWRPMRFEIDGENYIHERAISTQQTGWSMVSQMRSGLPSPIGGILWFGVDDTYSTVYVPMYCAIDEPPKAFAEGNGSLDELTWDSAFWVFNFVTNYAYSRYSDMIQDIRKVQQELEGRFEADQESIEKTALNLHQQQGPSAAITYLTKYSAQCSELTMARWKKLGEHLIWKYLDGNVRSSTGTITQPKYPDAWYKRIVQDHGDTIKMAR
jgi:dipeptidase